MLRCAVLLFGEKCDPPWWGSQAASKEATDFRFVFPRTAMCAAFTRASELAKALHDERTKQQGVHHLFRLPHAIEADIHREMVATEQSGELTVAKIESFFEDFLSAAPAPDQAAEGAIDCGKISISKQSDLRRIGALYLHAFKSGSICLPYFLLHT